MPLALLRYVGVFGGNVRVVEAGRLYRSAQLTGADLIRVLNEDRIRTVVNLRGYLPKDADWRSEAETCARSGIAHIDIRLSAERLPPPQELAKLMIALDTAPRPVLVHCRGGADRSGLAATLYLSVCRGVRLDEAERSQLTWRYGHLSFGPAHAMDDFFTLYRQTGKGLALRDWIVSRYPSVYAARGAAGKISTRTEREQRQTL